MPGADPWTLPELLAASEHAVNARTVRFWINEGLVPAPSGGRGVHARYGARHAARIAEIRRLQRLGLSLANIGLLLRAESGGRPTPAQPGEPGHTAPAGAADDGRTVAEADVASGTEAATAALGAAGFWHRPPAPAEVAVALAPGVRLLVDRDGAHQLDDAAVDELRRAAGPLLALLAARREASISTGRSDPSPSTPTSAAAPAADARKGPPHAR